MPDGSFVTGLTVFINGVNLIKCTAVLSNVHITSNEEYTMFYNCEKMINCNSSVKADGYNNIYSFSFCKDLVQCRSIMDYISTGISGFGGYVGCSSLLNCTSHNKSGSGSTYDDCCGFSSCTNMTGCKGYGWSGDVSNSYDFLGCRVLFGCAPLELYSAEISAGKNIYMNCYMNATGTANPVADTAAGGYNRLTV